MKPQRLMQAARAAFVAGVLAATLGLPAQAVGRLADVSIFDRATGRTLPVHWHEGRAYVVGRPGNEYQEVLHNRAGEDLLAVVSVDGVNVLSGQTAAASQGGYVLSPWQQTSIRGWRKSLDEVASFYFTSLGNSYAGRTGRPENVGVIGVALFQRQREEPPPAAEIAPEPWRSKREGAAADAGAAPSARAAPSEKRFSPAAPLGTGHGRRESSQARHVDFQRRTAQPVETIAIYYDSYRNLVAQGVLPVYRGPRDPNPFPTGFVPDPH